MTCHRHASFALALTAAAWSAAADSGQNEVLWREDFDGLSPASAWLDNVIVQPDGGSNDSACVEAAYHLVRGDKNSGSNRMVKNIPFAEQAGPEVTLSYRVKFMEDFDTGMGGKFLGVGPEHFATGGRNVTPEGWSARVVMVGRVPHVYVYDQDKDVKFGRKLPPLDDTPLTKGDWHAVSLHVRLNSGADTHDGLVELYVDGVLRAGFAGARLRGVTSPATLPSVVLFHTFLGGTGVGTPLGTQHARFDDLSVHAGLFVLEQ